MLLTLFHELEIETSKFIPWSHWLSWHQKNR
jgi:hypothetical protein